MRGKGKGSPPEDLPVEEELSSCPRCSYGAGFHVAFRRRGRSLAVFLICPSCSDRFTAGEWNISTGEPRPVDPDLDEGP